MATRKEIEDAAAEVAEPVAAQIAALRADMAELGALVSRIGKQRAAGLKSAADAHRGGRLRQGRGSDRRGAGRAAVARGRAGRGHPAAALRLARPRGARRLPRRRLLPAVSVARLFATVSRVAEARVRNVGRRASRRAALIGGCVLAALLCLAFALIAATVALAERFGTINALAIMAGGGAGRAPPPPGRARLGGPAAPPPRRPARGARPPARPGGGALARGGRAAVAAGDRARAGGHRGAHGAPAAGSRLRRAGRCSRSPRTTRTDASCCSRWGACGRPTSTR